MRFVHTAAVLAISVFVCAHPSHAIRDTTADAAKASATKSVTDLYLYTFHGYGIPKRPDFKYCFADQVFPRLWYPRDLNPDDGTMSAFHSVTLENKRLLLVQVSDLGGQTFTFRDKRMGMDIAYSSTHPRLSFTFALHKAAHVAFPVTEHGLNALEPWSFITRHDTLGASTIFTKTDDVTGLRMTVTTFMPHQGYYIDKTAVLENPGPDAQKGMMWSVHVVENHPGAYLFWPATESYCHTGMTLRHNDDNIRAILDYHAPIRSAPVMDIQQWPVYTGMYASNVARNWAAIHNCRQRRGLVKLFGGDAVGLKFYSDADHAEIFVGITPALESYGAIESGGRYTLTERILPTVGLRWANAASRAGAAGLFRDNGDDSLHAEFLLCEAPAGSVRIALAQGRREIAVSERALAAGDIIRCAVPWSEVKKGKRARPVSLMVADSGRSILTHSIVVDSIQKLTAEQSERVPVDTVLALQASAWQSPEDDDPAVAPARKAGPGVTAAVRCVFADSALGVRGNRSHVKGSRVGKPGGAVRRGDKTWLLTEKKLLILHDTISDKPGKTRYCYNSSYDVLLDSSYRGSRPEVKSVKLGKPRWFTTPALFDTMLALGLEKRLELRDTAGVYRDSVPLNAWVGHVERHDKGSALVTLPYENAVAVVDLASGAVRRHSLGGRCGFRYPWAATRVPGGWAFSSATDYRILITDERFDSERLIEIPFEEPWNRQFRGINALLYHPALEVLLVADLDNMRILKVGLDGEDRGVFTEGGFSDTTTLHVRHMELDENNNIIITHLFSTMSKSGGVIAFSPDGEFMGSTHQIFKGGLQWCNWIVPHGNNRLAAYSAWTHALHLADSAGVVLKSAGHYGWTPGHFVYPPGGRHGNGQGWAMHPEKGFFIADVLRHVIVHFDTAFQFKGELTPDTPLNSFSPTAITVDKAGFVHAVDGARNCVSRFAPSDSGYRYIGDYGAGAGVSLQRIYTQGEYVVLLDVFERSLIRCRNGVIVDRTDFSEDFLASIVSVCDAHKNLYIKSVNSDRVLKVTPDGAAEALDIPGFSGDLVSITNLENIPGWLADSRPSVARYVALTRHSNRRWLDKDFRIVANVNRTLSHRTVRYGTVFDNFAMFGVRGWSGVAITDTANTQVTWINLGFDGSHCEMFRRKSPGVFGAIIKPSNRYIEFTRDGTVVCLSSRLPGSHFWNWSYAPDGNIVIPDYHSNAVMIISPEGQLIRKVDSGLEGLEAAVATEDGMLYTLSWHEGAIACVDSSDSCRILFSGGIEGRHPPGRCAWFERWDDKLLVADNKNGKINVLGMDGTWRGSWPPANDNQDWKNSIWGAQSPQNGTVVFWGRGGLQEVRFSETDIAE